MAKVRHLDYTRRRSNLLMQRRSPFTNFLRMPTITYPSLRENFPVTDGTVNRWGIPLDIVEEDGNILVHASLPGFNPDDITVSIEDDVLTIKGQTEEQHERKEGGYLLRERRSGSFYRSLRLPETVDADKAEPHYENGVLTITMPKVESKKVKHLKVNSEKAPEATEA